MSSRRSCPSDWAEEKAAEIRRTWERHIGGVEPYNGTMESLIAQALREAEQRGKAEEQRRHRPFPIMGVGPIPWSLMEPGREQAMRNHNQTLERLAERGGLDPVEAVGALLGLRWRDLRRVAAAIKEQAGTTKEPA